MRGLAGRARGALSLDIKMMRLPRPASPKRLWQDHPQLFRPSAARTSGSRPRSLSPSRSAIGLIFIARHQRRPQGRADRSSMSTAGRPTAASRRRAPSSRPTRSGARQCRGGAPAPVPEARRLPQQTGPLSDDSRWMAEAIALGEEARGTTAPNPNVGCVIVARRRAWSARGATQPGGRPHAEAVALAEAGDARAGRDALYQPRALRASTARAARPAPICSSRRARAGGRGARAIPIRAPTGAASRGCGRRGSTVEVGIGAEAAERSMEGFLTRVRLGRPVRHAEAGAVDRRQDRLAVGREQMDHRRRGAPARPSSSAPAPT